jgi:hypothetical protein
MKRIMIAALGAVLFCPGAFADAKLTDAEVGRVKQALAAWGCEGGKYEKE